MDGRTESASSRNLGYVTRTKNMPYDALQNDNRIFTRERVLQSAARRCQLLSGISDTVELASLPTSISAADFRLWQTACVIPSDLSSDELSTVLKVAHAMGDTDTSCWTYTLATKICTTNWRDADESNTMLCGLLLLPQEVLLAAFADCMAVGDFENIFHELPTCLRHPFLSAAAIRPVAYLRVPTDWESAHVLLAALASQPLPPPGLQTLFADDPEASVPTAMAALLARAACAQTSLTSLCLMGLHMPPDSLRAFGAALALSPPPRLAGLSICTDGHPCGVAALAECLRPLASLTSLAAIIRLPVYGEADVSGDVTPLETLNRLAAAPVVLPQLQRLELEEYAGDPYVPTPAHTNSCFGVLLLLVSATALESVSLSTLALSAEQLGAALCRHKASRTLQLAVAYPGCLDRFFGNELADIHLPSLEDVSIESHCPLLRLALPGALPAATAASLTSLTIKYGTRSGMPPHCQGDTLAAWRSFWSSVSTCSHLRQLHLTELCSYRKVPKFNEQLRKLSSLTELTSLQLQADGGSDIRTVLKADSLFSTLQTLPQLRSVHLRSGRGRLTFDSVPTALAELARMHVLEELGMAFHGVTLSDAAALLPRLPALRRLGLHHMLYYGQGEHGRCGSCKAVMDLQSRFPGVDISPH